MAGRSIWDNLMYQSKYNPYGRQQQDDTTPTQGDIDEVASEPPAKVPPVAPMRQPQMPDVAPPLRFSTASMASNDDMMTDADYQRISERARGYSGFEARHADLAGMREGLEKYLSQDQQVDLSPLAALTDAWTGSKFAQSYKAPTSAEERQLTAAKLQDMIAQKQAGLNDDEIKLINSQISGQQNALMKKMGWDQAAATRKVAQDQHTADQAQKVRKDVLDSGQGKQITGILSFGNALDNYEKLVDKHGLNPVGEASKELSSAYSKLETAYKEAEKLGALAGPDLEILKKAVGDAGGFGTWFSSAAKGGVGGVKAQINQMRVGAKNDFDRSLADLKSFDPNNYASDMYQGWERRFNTMGKASSKDQGIPIGTEFSDGRGGIVVYQGGDPISGASYLPKTSTAGGK